MFMRTSGSRFKDHWNLVAETAGGIGVKAVQSGTPQLYQLEDMARKLTATQLFQVAAHASRFAECHRSDKITVSVVNRGNLTRIKSWWGEGHDEQTLILYFKD